MDMPYFIFKFSIIVPLAYFQFFAGINHALMNILIAKFFF